MGERASKSKKDQKQSTERIEQLKTFVIVHSRGQKTILAPTDAKGRTEAYYFLLAEGMHPKRDWKDFYEVKS